MLIISLLLSACSSTLPPYSIVNNPNSPNREVLRQPGETIKFPLSAEDRKIINELEAKFDAEENCAGLAAQQIGYNKRIIIIDIPNDPTLKKWRPDLSDTMPKTILINPTYAPVGSKIHVDWEACFSVDNLAGHVARYSTIRYEGFTIDGKKVSGIARGFLARVLQHEIDHTDGKLYLDCNPQPLMSWEELRKIRNTGNAKIKKSCDQ
jgi:peptide deformylase